MRIDRLFTLYFFYPLSLKKNQSKEHKIPILMYHSISNKTDNVIHPYYQSTTTPKIFRKHMEFLYENKCSVISLKEALKYFRDKKSNYYKPVVITFDDGFADFYNEALPILSLYNFCATVFLPTKFIGDNRKRFKGKECLTWGEIRKCQIEGIDFGSHTNSHIQLLSMTKKKIEVEIKVSKIIIEDNIGSKVETISYPYAFPEAQSDFNSFLKKVLKENGYKNGVTTIIGTANRNDCRYFMKRIPVNTHDDLQFYKAKLEGGYNWLHGIQYIKKKIIRS